MMSQSLPIIKFFIIFYKKLKIENGLCNDDVI